MSGIVTRCGKQQMEDNRVLPLVCLLARAGILRLPSQNGGQDATASRQTGRDQSETSP